MSTRDGFDPAFPMGGDAEHIRDFHRMTLRDWFAGQALCGLLANTDLTYTGTGDELINQANEFATKMIDTRP